MQGLDGLFGRQFGGARDQSIPHAVIRHIPMYIFTPQQHCLAGLASGVWRRRGAAKHNGLSFSEETVTEWLLLELALRFPGNVKIVPFTKKKEGLYGADWAWAFIGPDGHTCQGMLVQSKRLDDLDRKYSSLFYRGRTDSSGRRPLQVDRLIETARKWNLPPVFAFYNHLDDTSRLSTTACGTLNMMQYPFPESWGVSLASAPHVRNAMPTNTFDYHHRISRPFHCLFCSRGTGTQDVDGIAGTAAAALSSLFEESGSDDALDPELLPPFQPAKTVPELFQRAEITTMTRLDDESPGLSDLRMDYPEIAGAVIVRDVPQPDAER